MKTAVLILVTLMVLGGGAFFFFNNKLTQNNSSQTPPLVKATRFTEETDSFTMEQIAAHNSKDSCWLLIDGSVYDVTSFVPEHPGEEKILEGCGKDATELFATKGGTGVPHSEKAVSMREEFKIGILRNGTQPPVSTQ